MLKILKAFLEGPPVTFLEGPPGSVTFLEGPTGKQTLTLDFNLYGAHLKNRYEIIVYEKETPDNPLFHQEYTKLVDNIQIPLNITHYPILMQLKYNDDDDYVPFPETSFINYPYSLSVGPTGKQTLNMDFDLDTDPPPHFTKSFEINVYYTETPNNPLFHQEYTKLVDNIQIPLNIKKYPIEIQLKYDQSGYIPFPDISFVGGDGGGSATTTMKPIDWRWWVLLAVVMFILLIGIILLAIYFDRKQKE